MGSGTGSQKPDGSGLMLSPDALVKGTAFTSNADDVGKGSGLAPLSTSSAREAVDAPDAQPLPAPAFDVLIPMPPVVQPAAERGGGLTSKLLNLAGNLAAHIPFDNRNTLNVETPDAIVFRMFDVLSSWQKTTKELGDFTRRGLLGYLMRSWTEPYLAQLVDELRVQSHNDQKFYQDSPLVHRWSRPAAQVQQSCYQYVCWKLTMDGGFDLGRHNLPHNQLQKLFWYHLLKTGKLQIHLHSEVVAALGRFGKKSKADQADWKAELPDPPSGRGLRNL